MRIQTRLFLGIAVPVLALTGCQWWLHLRQLKAVERQLAQVATSVGRGLIASDLAVLRERVAVPGTPGSPAAVKVITVTDHAEAGQIEVEHLHRMLAAGTSVTTTRSELAWVDAGGSDVEVAMPPGGAAATATHRVKVEVIGDGERHERFLVVTSASGAGSRIPIPVAPAVAELAATQRQGLWLGAGLLAVGLVASGVMANRMARPLRDLAARAERLGEGELGATVAVTASGEVGDLQRAFNRMSARLAELETERERWREREHLAQLGDLSRGLAHTLRNPLNTLGLAVEELAGPSPAPGSEQLVATARAQIGRIDRWLKSFLALGAGEAAAVETVGLAETVRAAVLESTRPGVEVALAVDDEDVVVAVVASALRAALANLLENALEALPASGPVEVRVGRRDELAVVTVADRGPGLDEAIRARLFAPHVTTKSGGAGMGLFLTRQLVVGMHGGRLEVAPRDGGGTVATVLLTVAGRPT
jgi:signal transduction histidine kinase